MLVDEFDFDLPAELIAQRPADPRDSSRLLRLDRRTGAIRHGVFRDLPALLRSGDVIVRNDTKVIPSRLLGERKATGGAWEGLYLGESQPGRWRVLAKTRGKPAPGEIVVAGSGLELRLLENQGSGVWLVEPIGKAAESPAHDVLELYGKAPLPPYIRSGVEGAGDRSSYQTIYAQNPGAVAAPTAGLHFTHETLVALEARGVSFADVTLHVGIGTFRPIEAEAIEDHKPHAEWARITPETAIALNRARAAGSRIIAAGTTSARVLETAARNDGEFEAFEGETSLYLRPGRVFRGLDALITNFHLPRSSLLVLVSALAGIEPIKRAYAEAIRERYRFYSYGDAMLIIDSDD